jgi:thioredoxin 1
MRLIGGRIGADKRDLTLGRRVGRPVLAGMGRVLSAGWAELRPKAVDYRVTRRSHWARAGRPAEKGDGKVAEIQEVTDATFDSEVTSAKGKVIVDFWAPWCGPCRMVGPELEKLSAEVGDAVKIVKMNVDENPQTAGKFGVMSIPTLILFTDGKLVTQLVGARPKDELKREFKL